MKFGKKIALIILLGLSPFAIADNNNRGLTCDGNWINPITDICWKCLFPMSIGNTKVSAGDLPDTANPSAIQTCPFPPPIFRRVGVAIGYWEPAAVTDVTRSPMCMVNLGGLQIGGFKKQLIGASSKAGSHGDGRTGTFYHTHWYQYPLISWLKIFAEDMCMQGGEFDIGYMSEIDPMWNDDTLSLYVNPEAVLFGNPIAQLACVADAIAAEAHLPLDALFWCAGSHGSIYPFTGTTSRENSPLNQAVLMSERMNFKLHRQGVVQDTFPYTTAVCFQGSVPIVPKERYRYQLVNPIPNANACHPYGRNVMRWQAGHDTPTTSKNYGYLIWRKRNCVVF